MSCVLRHVPLCVSLRKQSNWELERAVLNRKIADVAAQQKHKQSQMVELAQKVRACFHLLEPPLCDWHFIPS